MRDLSNDEVLELEWYFGGGAEADLGARSIQSGFEAQMHRMALSGPRLEGREVWTKGSPEWLEAQQPAKDTRSTCSASDDAIERLYHRRQKLADARRIYQRLQQLGQRNHAVLELQFGDAVRIQGVSLSLLCMTRPVRVATAKVNEKRRRRAEKQDREPPDDLGPRDAVQRMHTSDSSAERAILDELVTEAAGWLRAALEAYSKARV